MADYEARRESRIAAKAAATMGTARSFAGRDARMGEPKEGRCMGAARGHGEQQARCRER